MSKLIVIEGAVDGIGKSTQYELLYNRLKENNINVLRHHFPSYNTYYGVLIEKYLSGEYGKKEELSPYFINSLYAIDRAITFKEKFSNIDNDIILLDRYTTSSLIYQSALIENIDEKKKFIDFVTDYEYNKLNIPKPDKVIFLNASFDAICKLREGRIDNEGVENDIHEKDNEFLKKVYDNSLFVADYLSWDIIECSSNDKMKSIDEIHEEIYKKIHMD